MTTNTMAGIVFDASCGISEEEQREIFAQINSIAEKNRLSLSASAASASAASASAETGKGKKKKLFKAKKSGSLFPVVVNAAAIAALAGGFLALYAFQGKTDAEVREGAKVYNSAERALIEEIRTDVAQGEMDRLSRDQAQTASVEAQMAAFFATLTSRINENRLDEAAEILVTMRAFLNTPSFLGLRAIQARKELYTQAINSFEIMVDELRRSQAALASGILSLDRSAEATFAQLQERATQLEQDVAERNRSITETERTLQADIDRERTRANSLQTQNSALQTDLDRERGRANSLQADVTRQTAAITNRNECIEQIQQIIQGGKALDDMSFNELRDNIAKIQSALQSLN